MAINSTASKAAIYSYERGCRVKANGDLIGVRGKPRKTRVDRNGYLTFNMKPPYSNFSYPVKVHKLVAYQIYGLAAFEEGTQIRHLNNIKTDNSPSNIAIGTQLDNTGDLPYGGANLHSAKLTPKNVIEIRSRAKNGEYYKDIIKDFPITSIGNISEIVNNKTWKNV